ncbi:MAG: leucine-rich repeat domain-containing protein, partial [Treponema sp.]|nr:leucine-rich repeat domain-containing protein [Treponema sp.]
IGNSVTSIGNSAFYNCTSLTSVTIPNSVTSMGNSFTNCTSLTSVTIGNSVTDIAGGTFRECTSLKSVTIGSSVTSIEQRAFDGCTGLTSVTFQGTIPETGFKPYAFGDSSTNIGDLLSKYLAQDGGIGTYTRESGGTTWTKQ